MCIPIAKLENPTTKTNRTWFLFHSPIQARQSVSKSFQYEFRNTLDRCDQGHIRWGSGESDLVEGIPAYVRGIGSLKHLPIQTIP